MSQKQKDNQKKVNSEEFEKLQAELSSLQELTSRLDGQLKRAVADYQNLEKRVAEGRSQLQDWASLELIKKILPSLDHLEKALSGVSDEEKKSGWLRGVELAVEQLKAVLKEEGLEEIEIDPRSSSGTGVTRFNPVLHEAVDTREGDDNIILEIVEKGYTLGGKVIKPAKVVVGKKG